jgi:murein L,D-transpeptidase YafK
VLIFAPLFICAQACAQTLEPRLNDTAMASSEAELPIADRVVVSKSQRRLHLYRRGQLLRSYAVDLGLRPEGPKEFEGDFRTPEGRYTLGRRNAQSDYFLSIQINYPNDSDLQRARRQRVKPGGLIMIHGLPNSPRRSLDYYQRVDWTDGCIALNNADMVEVWLMTRPGTLIDITP